MSKPQTIQILEEHQDLVQKLTAQINTAIGQSHYSFHINSAEKLNSGSNTEYHFKIKSNDGQLYKVVILQHGDDKPAQVLSGSSLYATIQTLSEHNQRIASYKDTINLTYKAQNSGYEIVSVQQLIEDPNNFIFKVRGIEDNKTYKVKIERPAAGKLKSAQSHTGTSVEA